MAVSESLQNSLYTPKLAELVGVESLTEKEKLFQLKFTDGSKFDYKPGQFVEVSVLGIGEAPISISSSPTRDCLELVVREIGSVTKALHRLKPGDTVGIRGPFGNGFPVDKLLGRDLLFVAGGIGLCPLRSMVQYALDNRDKFGKLTLLYGCREPAEQLFREELTEWKEHQNTDILKTVDACPLNEQWDGSLGVITTLFPQITVDASRTSALVVGPPVMFRFVVAKCLNKGIAKDQIYLSLERLMKCGIGFCGHCQVNNIYICQDGPVFTYTKLSQLKEIGL